MKKYSIYAKDLCLFDSIDEKDFDVTWKTLRIMVGIMKTDYCIEDLYYQESID
jgi:hypothetical protein